MKIFVETQLDKTLKGILSRKLHAFKIKDKCIAFCEKKIEEACS